MKTKMTRNAFLLRLSALTKCPTTETSRPQIAAPTMSLKSFDGNADAFPPYKAALAGTAIPDVW